MDCCFRDSASDQLMMRVKLSATISQDRSRAIDNVADVLGVLPRPPVATNTIAVRVCAPLERAGSWPAVTILERPADSE